MNKKLLKGALALFASIFMAVSCSNKDTSGPGDTTPSVSKSDVETFLKRLNEAGNVTVGSDAKLETGNVFSVALDSAAGLTVEDVKSHIVSKLGSENSNIKAISAQSISDDRLSAENDESAVTYNIKLEAKNGYNIGSYGEVKVKVAASREKKWKKLAITKAMVISAIKSGMGKLVIDSFTITEFADSKISFENASAAGKIFVKLDGATEITDASGKKSAAETALNAKFTSIKEALKNIGINIKDSSFGVYSESTTDLSTAELSASEFGLFKIDPGSNDFGTDYNQGPLTKIKITLKATGNWS